MSEKCPYCRSDDIGVGYQLGGGRIFADEYAAQTARDCSEVEYLICKSCGSIIRARVLHPEVFHPADRERQEKLLDFIDLHGVLLCNESPDLPSLSGRGFDMESVMGLVDLHQVFYCMAYKKRSTFLAQRAYYLLKRCRTYPAMDADCEKIFRAARTLGPAEKDELKEAAGMEKKAFEKAFRFLLENLYLTAYGRGKRLNPDWYTYLYCTAERWEKETHGLHFSGDARQALSELLCSAGGMSEEEFRRMVK